MKKLISFIVAVIATISIYANTCIYSGVEVTLKSESVSWQNGKPLIFVSVSDTNVSEVRCQVSCNGRNAWVTIPIYNGNGVADLSDSYLGLSPNQSYTVKLVHGKGQCYN